MEVEQRACQGDETHRARFLVSAVAERQDDVLAKVVLTLLELSGGRVAFVDPPDGGEQLDLVADVRRLVDFTAGLSASHPESRLTLVVLLGEDVVQPLLATGHRPHQTSQQSGHIRFGLTRMVVPRKGGQQRPRYGREWAMVSGSEVVSGREVVTWKLVTESGRGGGMDGG